MRTNRRLRLATLIATFFAAIAVAIAAAPGAAVADGPCPDGTSWDNITHTCH